MSTVGGGTNIVTSGMIVCMDGINLNSYVSGSTIWYDMSRNSNHGTLVNGAGFDGAKGVGVSFNGTNSYMDIVSSQINAATTLTIDADIKWNAANGGMFLGFNTYDIWTQSNTLGYNNGASNVVGISAATVTALGLIGNYRHYTFTMNTTGLLSANKIHINGVEQVLTAVVAADGNAQAFGTTLRLASWPNTGYHGNVTYANLKIYNRALTQAEITQNFNATRTRYNL